MENKTCALLHKIDRNKDICINCIFITFFFVFFVNVTFRLASYLSAHIRTIFHLLTLITSSRYYCCMYIDIFVEKLLSRLIFLFTGYVKYVQKKNEMNCILF
jgi:hypothetical protein